MRKTSLPNRDGIKQIRALVESIKQEIIFGRLRPRERLVEDDLIRRFDVSRHLVRSAFAELQQMGLVTRRPNKGVIVRDFAPKEVDEVYEMRALLQSEAIRRIAFPVEQALIDQLEETHAAYEAAIEAHDLKQVCALNNDFHHTLFSASNNHYLTELIHRAWIETLGIRCYAIGDPQLLERSRQDHRQMLDALRAGDRTKLIALCAEHIWPALEAYKVAHGGWQYSQEGRPSLRIAVSR
ncbi:MAG: GntR family transcriptional regulator [Pseudomonadota bacterium]